MAGMGTPMRLEVFIQEHSADLINTDFGSWLLRADCVEKVGVPLSLTKPRELFPAESDFRKPCFLMGDLEKHCSKFST